MLSSISWPQFLTFMATVLVIYYFLIAVLFYRRDIMGRIKRKTVGDLVFSAEPGSQSFSPRKDNTVSDTSEDSSRLLQVHELLEELKTLFRTAAKAKTMKEELVMALQLLLRGYRGLYDLAVTTEINRHIAAQCQHICSITLSDAETEMLWNG